MKPNVSTKSADSVSGKSIQKECGIILDITKLADDDRSDFDFLGSHHGQLNKYVSAKQWHSVVLHDFSEIDPGPPGTPRRKSTRQFRKLFYYTTYSPKILTGHNWYILFYTKFTIIFCF